MTRRSDMNKTTVHQSRLDIERLLSAADRLVDLHDAYANTKHDLKIAIQGLKTIATWASCPGIDSDKELDDIHERAMDTLALISEANR